MFLQEVGPVLLTCRRWSEMHSLCSEHRNLLPPGTEVTADREAGRVHACVRVDVDTGQGTLRNSCPPKDSDRTAVEAPMGLQLMGGSVLRVEQAVTEEGPAPGSPELFLSLSRWIALN